MSQEEWIQVETLYDQIEAEAYGDSEQAYRQACRELGLRDLYYYLTRIKTRGQNFARREWVYDRCREVQNEPYGHVDLWSRFGFKSSIQVSLTEQSIIAQPEKRRAIFSHTNSIARGFLREIKSDFENNEWLKALYPDVLWPDPKKDAPKWTEDDGIIVKRSSNPKECTLEAYGLVDAQPTSRHYDERIYDDVVTVDSVTSPEMIKKVTTRWEMSLNLTSEGGVERYYGTRYHYADTYQEMRERGYPFRVRVWVTPDGKSLLLPQTEMDELRQKMGPYTWASQILQDPGKENAMGFKADWIRYWKAWKWDFLNVYIMVDPASSKKSGSDYTAIIVAGLGEDGNLYVINIIRDRLNLTQITNKLIELHRQYKPIMVGYEKYGAQNDVHAIEAEQSRIDYRFPIIPLGGATKKEDRIRSMVPDFERHRVYLPESCVNVLADGSSADMTKVFVDELLAFPYGKHDDMIDCLARIKDENMGAAYPQEGSLEARRMAQLNRTFKRKQEWDPYA